MKYLNDVSYKTCVGKVCKSLNSGDFKILKYNNARDVEIQFLKTGYRKVAEMKEVKTGSIKDPYSPSVYGVGVIGTKYLVSEDGRDTKEYTLWNNMLNRCYNDTYKNKNQTYTGCEASENFKSYEYFYEWCNEQVGFGNEGWHLDKDLLVKGNKIYSEDTCVFLPHEINQILVKRTASRGNHLIGVYYHKRGKVFMAQVSKNKGKQEKLGSLTPKLKPSMPIKLPKNLTSNN